MPPPAETARPPSLASTSVPAPIRLFTAAYRGLFFTLAVVLVIDGPTFFTKSTGNDMSSSVLQPSPASSLDGPVVLGVLLALGMAGVVGSALAFEHIGGFIPCALCLKQRIPYYAGIPVAALAALAAAFGAPRWIVRGLFLVAALLMSVGAGLGVFHSGVEWGFWEGPASCGGGAVTTDAGNLLSQLNATQPPSCNEAAGRFLGLSFAGWNVITSIVLAAIALRGAATRA